MRNLLQVCGFLLRRQHRQALPVLSMGIPGFLRALAWNSCGKRLFSLLRSRSDKGIQLLPLTVEPLEEILDGSTDLASWNSFHVSLQAIKLDVIVEPVFSLSFGRFHVRRLTSLKKRNTVTGNPVQPNDRETQDYRTSSTNPVNQS